jgi:hypothetical protein
VEVVANLTNDNLPLNTVLNSVNLVRVGGLCLSSSGFNRQRLLTEPYRSTSIRHQIYVYHRFRDDRYHQF